jgi:hypothetical protein
VSLVRGLLNRGRTLRARYAPLLQNRWLRLALQVLILLFCAVYLVRNLQGIENPGALLKGNLWLALAALAGTIGSTFLGALNWWIVLRALEQPAPWRVAFRIHLQSNLAKYLPGYFWQLLGKAYMTHRSGSSLRNVSLALMVEMGITFATGIGMMLLFLPRSMAQASGLQNGLPLLAGAAVLLLAAIPFVTRWLVRRLGSPGQGANLRYLAGSELLMVVNWVLIGWYFWLLGNVITPVGIDQLPAFIFVLTTSFLIGFLVLIVPGSIGVREAIIVFLLGPVLTNPLAVVVALLDRAAFILGEVLSYLIFWIYERLGRF